MKLLLILTLSLMLQISNETQIHFKNKGTLSVKLEGIQTEKGGKIYIALFNQKGNYMSENRYKGLIVDVNDEDSFADISFIDLPEGDYAVTAFHDTNGNGEMDFDSNGMPLEAWATSGKSNPYGPPTWETSKIELKGGDLDIKLNFKK